MSALETRLRDLGAHLHLPPERDLAPAVLARLDARRPVRRLALALALAAALLALAVALAVPPARSAILRLFGVGGVQIEFVDRLPEHRPARPLVLGSPTTVAEAELVLGARLAHSALLGEPDSVHLFDRRVNFVYGRAERPRLIVTQFRGHGVRPELAKKVAAEGTTVEAVTVAGAPGFWISGRPHFFFYLDEHGQIREDTFHLAGNTLVWLRGPLTIRLEGAVTKERALALARSFR